MSLCTFVHIYITALLIVFLVAWADGGKGVEEWGVAGGGALRWATKSGHRGCAAAHP
jgi:hypothetical protein